MEENSGRKSLAKLMLNSLWGKFAQRPNFVQSSTCYNAEQYQTLERRWDNDDIDIVWAHEGVSPNDGAPQTIVMYREFIEDRDLDSKMNIAIAAFVTAHARLRLWTEMKKLGKRVVYHDTDSIIYEYDANAEYNIECGRYLGEWEHEKPGLPINAFVSTGPKTYAYRYLSKPMPVNEAPLAEWNKEGIEYKISGDTVQKQVYKCKAKGITLNYESAGEVDFHGMHKLILGQKESLRALMLNFKWARDGDMSTSNVEKYLKWSYDKGIINDDYMVVPKGYELFPEERVVAMKRQLVQ